MSDVKITRALVSVSDKSGVVDFVKKLVANGVEVLSTGGTAKLLKENGVEVTSVDSYTGHPEIMNGRVKTLHPKVHGGILAMRDNPSHVKDMEDNGIKQIDLVAVNLYPFRETIAKPDVTIEDAVENIDIGGPTMIRSTAKNHKYTAVVVDPSDYDKIADEISEKGGVSEGTRKKLALKAFTHTAEYDTAISKYLGEVYK